MKEIDLSASRIIGKGQCSQVYQIAENRVVKLFEDSMSKEDIQKEYDINCEAFNSGLASVQCFGLVTYKGRLGIEMEKVNGICLEQAILDSNDEPDKFAINFAQNLLMINSKRGDLSIMPAADEFYSTCVKKCLQDRWISEFESEKLLQMIKEIPQKDLMIHGDYHVLNMMVDNGSMKMIDLADCMTGNAIYDLMVANIYLHYLPLNMKELYSTLIKIPPETSLYMWDIFLKTYFDTESEKRIFNIKRVLDKYSMLKIILAPYSFSNLPKESLDGFVKMARNELMPEIDNYIGIIPDNIMDLCL